MARLVTDDVPETKRAEVVGAIQVLAQAIDSPTEKLAPTVAAVETIAESSPTLRQRMRDLYWGVAANFATDATKEVAVYALPIWARAITPYSAATGHLRRTPD